MCGRYLLTSAPEAVQALFAYEGLPNFPPRYNITPTQPVPVVVAEGGRRAFKLMRWGFVPSWVKDPAAFSLIVNARAETVFEKPAFRAAIRHRRCLVPSDGYYEWQARAHGKQPFLIAPREGRPIALAGLYETWCGPNGEEMDTVAIVTVAASAMLGELHERMPALIAPQDFNVWLDCRGVDPQEAARLLARAPEDMFVFRPVSRRLNRADSEGADLIAPFDMPEDTEPEKVSRATAAKREKPARPKPERDDGQGSLF